MTTVLARGTFATGNNVAGLGDQQSQGVIVGYLQNANGFLAVGGDVDANNVVRLQKRTAPGGPWSTAATINAVQTLIPISVVAGEEYRFITVAMEPLKTIHYKFSLES